MKKWLWLVVWSIWAGNLWANELLIDLASEIEPGQVAEENEPRLEPESNAGSEVEEQTEVATTRKPPAVSLPPVLDEPAAWGYYGEIAPRFWATLDQRYAQCATGQVQSPINLTERQAVNAASMPGLDIAYRQVPLRLIHSDHGLRGNYPLGSFIRLGDERYEFTHYIFRTPSEHQLEGFAYPMEIQLYHRDGEGNQVVMSVIVQEGRDNPALEKILANLPSEKDRLQVMEGQLFNPVSFLPNNKQFYRYLGSLTTPPCSEGVVWLVFKNPVEASIGQLVRMHELMGDNVRPLQPLNRRLPLKSWARDGGSNQPPMPRSPGYYFEY